MNITPRTLTEAYFSAGKALGLTDTVLRSTIGSSKLSTVNNAEIQPNSTAGIHATKIIRCYEALSTLVGGNQDQIQYWMTVENHHTNGIPIHQIEEPEGLDLVLRYLEGIQQRA